MIKRKIEDSMMQYSKVSQEHFENKRKMINKKAKIKFDEINHKSESATRVRIIERN